MYWIKEKVILYDAKAAKKGMDMGIREEPEQIVKNVFIDLDQVCVIIESISGRAMLELKSGSTLTISKNFDDFMIDHGEKIIEMERTNAD
jgi:hypothetical protein